MINRLDKIEGVILTAQPGGAFYVFMDVSAFFQGGRQGTLSADVEEPQISFVAGVILWCARHSPYQLCDQHGGAGYGHGQAAGFLVWGMVWLSDVLFISLQFWCAVNNLHR